MQQILIGEEPIAEKVRESAKLLQGYKEGNIMEVGPFVKAQYDRLDQLKPLGALQAIESPMKAFPLTIMDNSGKYIIGDANLRLQMEGYRYLADKMEKVLCRRENEHMSCALKWILDLSIDESEQKKEDSQDVY